MDDNRSREGWKAGRVGGVEGKDDAMGEREQGSKRKGQIEEFRREVK